MEYGQPCSVGSGLSWNPGPAAVTALTSSPGLSTAAVVPMEPRIVFTQAERSFETEKETGALNSPNKQEVDNLK